MSMMEMMVKKLEMDQSISGLIPFGKRVGFAGESIEPITQDPVEAFQMDGSGGQATGSHGGTDLNGEQPSPCITILDALGQTHGWRHDPAATSPAALAW